MGQIIGAEALISRRRREIIKERIPKIYRIPEIDNKIRKQRTRREISLLEKSINLIPVPKIISSNEYRINLELIKGKRLSEHLDSLKNKNKIAEEIRKNIAKLHDKDIIHGDLTTSNMIFSKNRLYFIDFGLGFISKRNEDKAVDLHLIRGALEARHFRNSEILWTSVKKGYKLSKTSSSVLKQLKKVETRGRYKKSY